MHSLGIVGGYGSATNRDLLTETRHTQVYDIQPSRDAMAVDSEPISKKHVRNKEDATDIAVFEWCLGF